MTAIGNKNNCYRSFKGPQIKKSKAGDNKKNLNKVIKKKLNETILALVKTLAWMTMIRTRSKRIKIMKN